MSPHCEDIVAALATGGPLRRWRARRHAARCPRCAAVRDELERLAETLAEATPLTAAERRLWAASPGDAIAAAPSRPRRFRPALAGILAAALLGAVAAWWVSRPNQQPRLAGVRPPSVPGVAPRDVERLRGNVVALVHELDDLGRRADLLDARKDVEELLKRLAPRAPARGL
jgi:hypothetical protein